MTALFFDLDGTLTDSSEGITKCAQLALRHFGIEADELEPLKVFIGPPLRETFPKYGIPEDRVEEAIAVFRSRYHVTGKFENRPYDGIPQVLEALKQAGYPMFVATSKPETTAREILDKFGMTQYFRVICGATMDGRIDSKEDVLKYLLARIGEADDAVMIGDTVYDVLGAKAVDIPTIGVSWGFGTRAELTEAGAEVVLDRPEALVEYLRQRNRAGGQ